MLLSPHYILCLAGWPCSAIHIKACRCYRYAFQCEMA